MAKIEIVNGELAVRMEGTLEKLMAMTGTVHVPMEHVVGLRVHPPELFEKAFIVKVFGASFAQTHIGYYWKKGMGMVFADIHDLSEVVAVDLKDERLKHFYIQVSGESAEEVARRLQAGWPELKVEFFPFQGKMKEQTVPVI